MNALQGVLYLCATPIGNLEDITFRAIRVLKEANLIAAEDTRHTRKLLNHYEIHTATVSYHEHNKLERGPELINRLLQGQTIALVSDAGMPGISDPGTHLTQLAIEAGITVIPVPGANAALSALVASGLDTTNFTFVGFLPKTKKKRRELLEQLVKQPYTLLFYESPHRIKETLKELETAFGDRPAAACRELTKKFEEFNRSTLLGLQQHFAAVEPRGEFTLVVQGAGAGPEPDLGSKDEVSLPEAVALLMAKGAAKKDALRQVAVDRGISRRDVYQAVLEAEK
ncbi:16S rRNA (cytidine1402-2'-O)-methyltransferase [Anaerospora hongkongensis]|uniref:Ribosomal RNA small subunit methyltransferase I n=1 Tax=Anaerospora hongkongensis TaxID=244830 RepID=A0A4R1PRQ0_9FIRM|nr:16S rRNA (cytidine(1402)-2'-O)-methyltransferase [Anaerospora hongkongensis]TCL33254.1 16S rRNA (cytidine1402-2'-O)-methyltransferase [Anaerospora hongkongensis]